MAQYESSEQEMQQLLSKQTMNFVRHASHFQLRRVLPAMLAAILALLVFVKVGLLDPLQQKAQAYEALSQKQTQLDTLSTRLADYEDLRQQFLRYGTSLMTEQEASLASRGDVLTLVEQTVSGRATIEDLTVNLNILTIHICDVTLEEAGSIVTALEANPLVTSAAIHSASANDGNQASIFISIVLADHAGGLTG